MKNRKILKPLGAMLIVFTLGLVGTFAYISDTTDEFSNEFIMANPGDDCDYLDIELTETFTVDGTDVDVENGDSASFLPGSVIVKKPVVTLEELDLTVLTEGAYVFVELTGDVDVIMALGFVVDSAWTSLDGVDNVYYMVCDSSTTATSFDVFSTSEITIDSDGASSVFENVQTLTVQAYAIQKNNIADASTAWSALGN